MTLGQCNLAVVFFTLFGLVLFKKGFPVLGGITLAVGISIKLTPGLFLLYVLYKRKWKMVTGIAVGTLLFSIGLPILILGFEKVVFELKLWWQVMRSSPLAAGSAADEHYVSGQTIRSVLMRLLTPSKISTRVDPIYVNITDVAPGTVEVLTYCISGLVLGTLAWNFRGSPASHTPLVIAIECALVMLTMTIISPFSRKAHYVSMIFSAVLMVHYLLKRDRVVKSEKLTRGIVFATIILVVGSSRVIVGRTASVYLNGCGIILVAALLMWGGLYILLFKERALILAGEQNVKDGGMRAACPQIND